MERDASTPLLYLAYKSPAANDSQGPAINLLLSVLTEGNSSRLHRLLVEEKKLAIEVGGSFQEGFDPGLTWLTLTLPEGELLLLGGDLAYPGASHEDYQYRFLELFQMARDPASRFGPTTDPRKFVCAIPQNHAWFDSAATFSRYCARQSQHTQANTPGSNGILERLGWTVVAHGRTRLGF